MSTTTSTGTIVVFPPRPPTVNSLPVEQRARLMRSTRKVGAVLGTFPRLVDGEDSPTAPQRPQHVPNLSPVSLVSVVVDIEPPTPTTPFSPTTVRRQKRRKLAKLQRTFGEAVDPKLVFPASPIIPCPRRSSLEPSSIFESSKTTLRDVKKTPRPTPAPLLAPLRKSSQGLLVVVEQTDSEWEDISNTTDSPLESDAKCQELSGLYKYDNPHLRRSTPTSPIAHRHTKSDMTPPSPAASTDAKRRKSNHRSTSIVDFSQIKFANEGDWNRRDIEEVRRALRGLKAM